MPHPKEEILIVGAGPTGLTAALTLAKRGIKPRIIDRRDAPISTSNAAAIQPRTLEIWKELDLIDDALLEGHRMKGITMSTSTKFLAEACVDDLPTPFPFILGLPQAKTERLLADHLARYGVTVERGVSLQGLTEKGDRIEADCNGKISTYSWVIGCDGAKSDVRQQLKISFQGDDGPQHFIMADIKVDWDQDPSKAHIFYSNEGPVAFFPFDNRGFGRLVIDVSTDPRLKEEKHPSFADFKGLMSKRCGVKATLQEPSWTSSFWIHSRIADSYQKGHLFLAGDAAHQHSPFGGQGLNTGVQDAYYLAVLLADVLEGKKSEEALKDYEKTRRPIGEEVVRRTALMTRIITTRSKPLEMLRNALVSILLRIPPIRRKALMNLTQLVYR